MSRLLQSDHFSPPRIAPNLRKVSFGGLDLRLLTQKGSFGTLKIVPRFTGEKTDWRPFSEKRSQKRFFLLGARYRPSYRFLWTFRLFPRRRAGADAGGKSPSRTHLLPYHSSFRRGYPISSQAFLGTGRPKWRLFHKPHPNSKEESHVQPQDHRASAGNAGDLA